MGVVRVAHVVIRGHVVIIVVGFRSHLGSPRRAVHRWIPGRVDVGLRFDAGAHETSGLNAIVVFVGRGASHSIGTVAIFATAAVASAFVLALRIEVGAMNSLHVLSERTGISVALRAAGSFADVGFLFGETDS